MCCCMNIHLFNHFLQPDDKAGTDPSSSDGGFKYIHNTDIVIVVGDTWYKSFLWFQNLYGTGWTCGYYTTDWQRYGKYAGEVSINFMHRTCIYTTHWALVGGWSRSYEWCWKVMYVPIPLTHLCMYELCCLCVTARAPPRERTERESMEQIQMWWVRLKGVTKSKRKKKETVSMTKTNINLFNMSALMILLKC